VASRSSGGCVAPVLVGFVDASGASMIADIRRPAIAEAVVKSTSARRAADLLNAREFGSRSRNAAAARYSL